MLSIRHTRKIVAESSGSRANSWRTILDDTCRRIRTGEFAEGDALPSVRSVAMQLGAHHSTVRKAYDRLADEGVIEKQAGQMARVTAGALSKVVELERRQFVEEELPYLVDRLASLGIEWGELLGMVAEHARSQGGATLPP